MSNLLWSMNPQFSIGVSVVIIIVLAIIGRDE